MDFRIIENLFFIHAQLLLSASIYMFNLTLYDLMKTIHSVKIGSAVI